jgi:hypothetical protein
MEAAVAATSALLRAAVAVAALLAAFTARAGVLPDDRADALYHSYDGGGVSISGPSLLVLKKVGQNVALTGNYYVDSISGASIDVQTISGASKYAEERTELSGGVDYQHGNSTMSLSYTNSSENDYKANTASAGISMDMFGNMTTVSMGYSHGWDTVGMVNNPSFSADVARQNYRLGLSQVLTRNLVLDVNYEGITDEGFLNNPYRKVRYRDSTDLVDGYSYTNELYPHTRTSSALALGTRYFLPWRAAVAGKYRYFTDTWGIDAHTLELGYTHPLQDRWMLETTYRYYTQTSADFYSDLLDFNGSQNFYGRDKELSTFDSNSVGFKLSYDFIRDGWKGLDHASLNLGWNHIWFNYKDFRDLRTVLPAAQVGTEPLYSYSADVVQFFVSAWF